MIPLRLFVLWCFDINIDFISDKITAECMHLIILAVCSCASFAGHCQISQSDRDLTDAADNCVTCLIASVVTHTHTVVSFLLTVHPLVMFRLLWIRLMSQFLWTQLLSQ